MIPTAESVTSQAREHAWKYFELHANQRLAVFNFFLVLSGALAAGIAATLQGSSPRLALLGVGLGVLLAVVSFIFWKLDQRVSFLVKHAEVALAEIEGTFPEPIVQLFLQEPGKTAGAKKQSGIWNRLWTYGQVFRLLFGAMAVTGIAGAVLCWLRFKGCLVW